MGTVLNKPLFSEEQGKKTEDNRFALLSETERELLAHFNQTTASFPSDKTVIDLFETKAAAMPRSIALISDDVQISYRELNERANQLANYLRKKGVGSETLVPLCMERTVNMVVGMLAILKTGGAYVPVDPTYPKDRIQFIIDDTKAALMLTDQRSATALPANKNISFVVVDSEWAKISKEPVDNLSLVKASRELAYVIYTSGSTGRPKGVMIEHGSFYTFICWCHEEFAPDHFEIVYAMTSVCFDLSVFEIFFPLTTGKPLRILENGLHVEKYLPFDKNILLNSIPGVIDSLLKQQVSLENVSLINMAGEPVSLHVLKALDTDRIRVRNLYGPTEDTTYSTVFHLRQDRPVLIGKPIANTKIYVLNSEQQVVPIGFDGEIYISGAGVARGYLNQEEMTGERFMPDPFAEEPGVRMYKTGDLGRWRADGNLEYLGRLDDQVKIRGYRIELAEIEYVLGQMDAVEKAVVIGKEDEAGNKRLIAYIIPKGSLDKEKLSAHLREKLPDYMIPSIFVRLEELPLTPNGKIDKRALPLPVAENLLKASIDPPRNRIEHHLAGIWKELLQIDKLGIHDNFFELGGDSILSMQMVSQGRRSGYLLQPVDVYDYDTIAKLAAVITARSQLVSTTAQTEGEDPGRKLTCIVPIQKEGTLVPLFAIPGFWLYRKLALHLGKDRPFYGFETYEYQHVENIAEHFISEMKNVQPTGPYYICAFCEHSSVAFEMAYKLRGEGEQVPLIVLIEAYGPAATLSKKSLHYIGKKIKFYYREMQGMSWKDNLKFTQRQLKMMAALVASKFKRRRTRDSIVRTYPGSVVLFKASVTPPSFTEDPQMGWESYIKGKITTITIKGDHFGILNEPAVADLAEKLKEVMAQAATIHQASMPG